MITLYGFGPAFDLPDPSPFVMKTEVLLRMAGLPYRRERGAPPQAPKGKVPWIADGDTIVADSTFIRRHLETVHGAAFDSGLDAGQKALAWSIERMLEDHLYWALLSSRWLDDGNFAKGPAHFFDGAPDGVREAARERTCVYLQGQGLGRHLAEEQTHLAQRDLESLSAVLGDKPYLFGDAPCGTDATAFAMLAGILTPFFASPLRECAGSFANLRAYSSRMMARYYPDFLSAAA